MSRRLLIAAMIVTGFAAPAWADPPAPSGQPDDEIVTGTFDEDPQGVDEPPTDSAPPSLLEDELMAPIKRFAITGGGALNVVMPAVQTNLGFRLPIGGDDWELLLGYGPINNAFFFTSDPPLMHTTAGMRWYLLDLPFFQLFASLTGGYMFQFGRNQAGVETAFSGTPTVMAGTGVNIMPWDHFGFTLGLDVGYPFILRPELDFRVVF